MTINFLDEIEDEASSDPSLSEYGIAAGEIIIGNIVVIDDSGQ